jgi:hypothetical protein
MGYFSSIIETERDIILDLVPFLVACCFTRRVCTCTYVSSITLVIFLPRSTLPRGGDTEIDTKTNHCCVTVRLVSIGRFVLFSILAFYYFERKGQHILPFMIFISWHFIHGRIENQECSGNSDK